MSFHRLFSNEERLALARELQEKVSLFSLADVLFFTDFLLSVFRPQKDLER